MSRSSNRCYSTGRRFQKASGDHIHAAWETQPLLREGGRPRAHPMSLIFTAFAFGLLLGIML
tara:strand:+ start:802 stop:987 length:186 start_codon:yes stop_codon:yes gene_type:complete